MTSTTSNTPEQTLKTYRVFLTVCESYKTYIEAPSQDAAQEIAEQLYYEVGTEGFNFHECGDESILVEEVR